MRSCILRKFGTIRLTTRPTLRNSAGTTTARIQPRPKSSRSAMITPPTIMIGADTATVQAISTSICTWVTSLVLRVISDGAPNSWTSRVENVPTRWNSAARRSRPRLIEVRAPNQTAATEHTTCTQRDGEHQATGAHDVAGVAGGDALVDDVGVEAGQVEHRHHADELERRPRRPGACGTARAARAGAGRASGLPPRSTPPRTRSAICSASSAGDIPSSGRLAPKIRLRRASGCDLGLDGELVAVRLEETGQPPVQVLLGLEHERRRPELLAVLALVLLVGGEQVRADRDHHRHRQVHPRRAPGRPRATTCSRRSSSAGHRRVELLLPVRGVDRLLGRRQQQALLVGEDPEDRALGDPGGLRRSRGC